MAKATGYSGNRKTSRQKNSLAMRRKKVRKLLITMVFTFILLIVIVVAVIAALINLGGAARGSTESVGSHEATIVFETPTPQEASLMTSPKTDFVPQTNVETVLVEDEVNETGLGETQALQEETLPQQFGELEETSEPEEFSTEDTRVVDEDVPVYRGIVCLTFDDGPSLNVTPQVLDILKEKGVKATFFILDFEVGSEKEALIRRAISEGHTIGIHGMSHEYNVVYASPEATVNNFTALHQKILDVFGYDAKFIRFPGGSSNTVSKKYCTGVVSEAAEMLTEMGYVYFDWNVDSDDAGSARHPETVCGNVINAVLPNMTSVVLMHDASTKQYTADALGSIIDSLLESGYQIVPIDGNIKQITHYISN